MLLGLEEWVSLAGIELPVIFCTNNSIIERKYDGDNLDVEDLIKWHSQY